jgi:hypothetical protein
MFQVLPLPRTLEAARRDLASAKAEVRADAARDLGQQGHGADAGDRITLLITALGDPAPMVRRNAVVALADLDAKQALPTLLGLLADSDLKVRQMAVLALGELAHTGDHEVEGRLLGLTRAGDAAIRYQALAALAGLVREGAREEILMAAADQDPEIRELGVRLAAQHLTAGRPLDPAVEALLEQAARDGSARVALAAEIEALTLGLDIGVSHLLDLLAGRMRGSEAADERRAIGLCAQRGISAALPILRRRGLGWLGISLDPYRWPIRAALAAMGEAGATRAIARGLRSRRWLTRTLAVEAAGEAGLVELRAHLARFEDRADMVDQDVLEQALLALSSSTARPAR